MSQAENTEPQGRNARRLVGLRAERKKGAKARVRKPPEDWTGVSLEQTPEQSVRLLRLREQFPRPWYVVGYRSEAVPTVLRRAFGVDWSYAQDARRPTLTVSGADIGALQFGVVISSADMVGSLFGTVFFIPDPSVGGGDGYLLDSVHHDEDYRSVVAYVEARNRGTDIKSRKSQWERRKKEKQLKAIGQTAKPAFLAVNLREWLHHNWNG